MFAVVRTGGKQYRVGMGDVIRVEKLTAEEGATVRLDQVLAMGGPSGTALGTPLVEGAVVTAEVVKQDRDPKIIIFKKRRRQNYRRKKGHRQDITVLKVTGFEGAGNGAAAPSETTDAETA